MVSRKKKDWSKEAKERLAKRLLEQIKNPKIFDSNDNKRKNLNKITDDFPRY